MIPPDPCSDATFHGAKAAILLGDRLLALLRDDVPTIPWPGQWDLPGGGREGAESPWETLAREVGEEVGLSLEEAERLWARPFGVPAGWFFVLRLPAHRARDIRLGSEGQGWALLSPARFATSARAVLPLRTRLALALGELGID
jgi:8-oxo-dGTP diphosphatase